MVLSLPCALGFNILSDFAPFGVGTTVQDLEDFLVTYNFLPLGSLAYLIFVLVDMAGDLIILLKKLILVEGLNFLSGLRYI